MTNFGIIKNVFNNLAIESIINNDANSKKLFKKYIKAIKESKILKTQFLVYNNIENRIDTDSASAMIFVFENLQLMSKFKKNDILSENKKLAEILGDTSTIDKDYDLSKLHESISNVIFMGKKPSNIAGITDDMKNISNYIVSNKPRVVNEAIDLPTSVFAKMMVDKFNEKYNDIDEETKSTLKILINPSIDVQKDFYIGMIDECVSLIDENLKESDGESKDKMIKVKNKLNEDRSSVDFEDIGTKIIKLIDLKNNLK